MTTDDFKQVLDKALTPIKEVQTETSKKLDAVSTVQTKFSKKLDEVSRVQVEFSKKLGEVSEDLNELKDTIESRVLPPLVYIETTIKGYADMYKINDSNIKKVEKRLETLEKNSGIDVPPELKLEPLA